MTEDIDKREFKRREFLKETSYTATSASGFVGLTTTNSINRSISGLVDKDIDIESNEVIITTVAAGDQPVLQKKVPADWWAYETKVDEVHDKLSQEFSESPDIKGIGIRTTKEKISGRKASEITFQVDEDGTTAKIPDQVEGINIEAVDEINRPPQACNLNTFDPLPGGVVMGQEKDTCEWGGGSTGCEVRRDGNYYMLTAAHVLLSVCGDTTQNNAAHPETCDYLGFVSDYDVSKDWAIVTRDPLSDIDDLDNTIAETNGILSGHVTYSGLKDLMCSGETVYQQGKSTCKTSGTVVGRKESYGYCGIDINEGVKVDVKTDDGDSGGPCYHKYTYNGCEYLSIIGTTTAYQVYSPAYKMNNNHGIKFDPEFELGYCK